MPRLTRWAIRASLLYLGLGFTLGGVMLVAKIAPGHPLVWRLLPAHIEFLLIGWMAQLAMGVGFWILPRFAGGVSRGRESVAWLACVLLNAGAVLAGLGPALDPRGWILLWGRAAEVGAAVVFAAHAWLRVKPPSV